MSLSCSAHTCLGHQWKQTATEEVRRLQAIADTALSHQTLDDLLPATLTRFCAALQMGNAVILLLEPDEQVLTMRAVCGPEEALRVPDAAGAANKRRHGHLAARPYACLDYWTQCRYPHLRYSG